MEVGKVANMVADVRHIGRTANVPELNWPQSGSNHRKGLVSRPCISHKLLKSGDISASMPLINQLLVHITMIRKG